MITFTERSFPQPTLSIYLGGTGVQVGESLLAMLDELPERDRDFFEPFFIDSQEPRVDIHERSRHYCYRDLNHFYDPVYQDFVDQRFPENLGRTPVINSCEGCGVTRIFGAASLVACRDDFTDLVTQAVGRLKKRRRRPTQPLQVFLTASACGGTGAGMILDAAALVRHLFRHRLGENPRIFLFLIGPTVYFEDPSINLREDQRSRMAASTYALLKELHHFSHGNAFVSSYRLRDERVEISNVAEDDRLFEWVYFVDGRPEQGGPTRTVAEVTWTLAEAQVHLGFTEVGRKVAESMPNQREERVKRYVSDFVHPDTRPGLQDDVRTRLEMISRNTFLASLGLRNVRFPAEEIKQWFRWRWVADGLAKVIERGAPAHPMERVDEFDARLGLVDGRVGEDGLLAELGLGAAAIARQLDPAGLHATPTPSLSAHPTPDQVLAAARDLLGEWQSWQERSQQRGRDEGAGGDSLDDLLEQAAEAAHHEWRSALAPESEASARLLRLAWDPGTGRGLRWLDRLLVHAAERLDGLARHAAVRQGSGELERKMEDLRGQVGRFGRKWQEEQKSLAFRGRTLVARWGSDRARSRPAGDAGKKASRLARTVTQLRAELQEQQAGQLGSRLAPRIYTVAAEHVRHWRESVLVPTLIAAENAHALAANHFRLATEALHRHTGSNSRGRWRSGSTFQMAESELLDVLETRIADRVRTEDLVVAPLQAAGISRGDRRLTASTLAQMANQDAVDLLLFHVSQQTGGILTFLDSGWMLPEVRDRLGAVAGVQLDAGSEPLVSFGRSEVGLQLQTYLITPPTLQLPEPFGRRVGQVNRLAARDPLQLGVVTFAFGIPPNALEGIADLFDQYTVHLGDSERHQAHDRFPMHVFRGAAERFDEPYSPLNLDVGNGFLATVLQAGRDLQLFNGGEIVLDIRRFAGTEEALVEDWNRVIELVEHVLRSLRRSPRAAQQLFAQKRFLDLEKLYLRRWPGPGWSGPAAAAGAATNGGGPTAPESAP